MKDGVLLEGRDIGTVIMPDADYKFFLVVSDEVAANRRLKEYTDKGIEASYEDILANVKQRNIIDSNRETAPLKSAEDAITVDTSTMNQFEVVYHIVRLIDEN
jgi:cytidylate kinase